MLRSRLHVIAHGSESAGFLTEKKGLKSSFNKLKLFCLDIFDQLVGFY